VSTEAGFDLSELEDVNREIIDLVDRKYPKAAKSLMNKQANSFRRKLRAAYRKETKKHTGNLLKGVSKSKVYVYHDEHQVRVRNKAPHAHLIEHGHAVWVNGQKTEKWVEGRHVAAHAMEDYQSVFEEEVNKFVDEILQEGFT